MITVMKLDSNGDEIGDRTQFPTVEQGQKWSEAQRGAKLQWGEEGRFFSLEGMTEEEVNALGETAEYPPVRFMICGVEDDGVEIRELELTDFEDADSVELERN